jgi:hypothetical protein
MRRRFEAPAGDPTIDKIATLTIAAAFGDTFDRAPLTGDWTYWRGKLVECVDRGFEINYRQGGPRAGMFYLWDRLIGWQAGDQDAPLYGPFARPANDGPAGGWRTALIDTEGVVVPVTIVVEPPPLQDDPLVAALVSQTNAINDLREGLLALTGEVVTIRKQQREGLVGNVAEMSLGFLQVPAFTVRLKPPDEG